MLEVDPDIGQPRSDTERRILEYMKEEKDFRLQMIGSDEVKGIKETYDNYSEHGLLRGSDLDMELLLEYVRSIVDVFEKKVQEPGNYQEFCKGVMDACHGFMYQIRCMHEAKKRAKRELLNEAKQEILDHESEREVASKKVE
jgi:hypothetical protein